MFGFLSSNALSHVGFVQVEEAVYIREWGQKMAYHTGVQGIQC